MEFILVSRITLLDLVTLRSFLYHYHSLGVHHVVLIWMSTVRDERFETCTELFQGMFKSILVLHPSRQEIESNCPDHILKTILESIQTRYPQWMVGQNKWLLNVDTDEYLSLLPFHTLDEFMNHQKEVAFRDRFHTISQFQFPWVIINNIRSSFIPRNTYTLFNTNTWEIQQPFFHVKSLIRLHHKIENITSHHFVLPHGTFNVVAGHIYIPYSKPLYTEFSLDYKKIPVLFHLQAMSIWNIFLKIRLHNFSNKSGGLWKEKLLSAIKKSNRDDIMALPKVQLCLPTKNVIPSFPFFNPPPLSLYDNDTSFEEHLVDSYFPNKNHQDFVTSVFNEGII